MGKKFRPILLLTALVFFSSRSYTQWFWQNPLPQGNTLNGVKFVSLTVGWAVGDDGTILKTTNSGTTWTQQLSGTTNDLNDVSFTDSNNGTAVGDYGAILRTTNGELPGLNSQAEQQIICMASHLPVQITLRLLVRMVRS